MNLDDLGASFTRGSASREPRRWPLRLLTLEEGLNVSGARLYVL